jgi:hypothetical protein
MPADIEFKIEGLDELAQRVSKWDWGPAARRMLDRATLHIEQKAKSFAPVDTGRLRASITHSVDPRPIPAWGMTGTNVHYARPMEYGTKRGHFPPPRALQTWAKRHGLPNAFLVARAISRQGLRPRAYMSKGFEDSLGFIDDCVRNATEEISRSL